MRARAIVAAGLAAVGLVAAGNLTTAGADQSDLHDVRVATARFHSIERAEKSGYERFLECFGSDEGGMGQHYVDFASVDEVLEPTHPEAMVYEVRGDTLKLVGVEYIVPMVQGSTAPTLFGERFEPNEGLGVWTLHAWVWRDNPTGTFKHWNPDVGACPT